MFLEVLIKHITCSVISYSKSKIFLALQQISSLDRVFSERRFDTSLFSFYFGSGGAGGSLIFGSSVQ